MNYDANVFKEKANQKARRFVSSNRWQLTTLFFSMIFHLLFLYAK